MDHISKPPPPAEKRRELEPPPWTFNQRTGWSSLAVCGMVFAAIAATCCLGLAGDGKEVATWIVATIGAGQGFLLSAILYVLIRRA